MKLMFLALALFSSHARADIYYQANTQVPSQLQSMIALTINQALHPLRWET